MEKIDKSYMKALREMNKSFLKARAAHLSLAKELEAAEKELSEQPRVVPSWDHRRAAEKAVAIDRYKEAKSAVFRGADKIWSDYNAEVSKIKENLVAELSDSDTLNASDIDEKAIALLSSGTMKARDLQRMAETYSENSTVLALVRKAAREYADGLRGGIDDVDNGRERLAALAVADNARTGSEIAIANFDNWVSASRTLAGMDSYGNLTAERRAYPSGAIGWEALLQSQGVSFNTEADSE